MFITFLTALPNGFDNLASSLRYVGSLNNWQEDGLHLYFSEYFGGGEEIVLGNTQQLDHDNAAVSLIVTGCQPWTIFQDRTYEVKGFLFFIDLIPSLQGYAICVYPSSEVSCTPGFYPFAQSISTLANSISSVRKGCFAKTKIYPYQERNVILNNR